MSDPGSIYAPGATAGRFDLSALGNRAVWDVRGIDVWALELAIQPKDPWPAAGVVTVKVSQDGINWSALASAVTFTAAGITRPVWVGPYNYVSAEVTTAGGSAVLAEVTGYGEASPWAMAYALLLELPTTLSGAGITGAASDITSGTFATARLGSGSASALTYLRGDQTWAVPGASHPNSATIFGIPGVSGSALVTAQSSVASTIYYHPIVVLTKITVTAITSRVSNTTTAGAKVRFSIYNADTTWQPTTLVADLGEMAVSGGAGIKTLGSLSTVLNPGLYLVRLHTDASATPPSFDCVRGNLLTGMLWDGVTNWQFIVILNKLSVTYAVAESPGTAWDTVSTGTTPMVYRFVMSWTPT